MNTRKKKIVGFILVAAMVLLSACSETEKGEKSDKEEVSEFTSQYADVAGTVWNETWKTDVVSGAVVNIKMNGYVTVPEVETMSVVEVEKFDVSQKNKKVLIESFFADGKVYYYDKDKEKIKGEVKSGKYKEECYLGERNGIQYLLDFAEYKNSDFSNIDITMDVRDSADKGPDELKGEKELYFYGQDFQMKEKNSCKFTEEEADEMAKNFLGEIGFADWVPMEKKEIMWYSQKGTELVDGYLYRYSPGVDGVSFLSYGYEAGAYSVDGEPVISRPTPNNDYSRKCCLEIAISDKGIINVIISNPIKVTSVTEDVKLLPFETIKNIMKSEMGDFAKNIYDKWQMYPNFKRMDLVYYRLANPGNKKSFTYIPAWRLNEYNGNTFAVNAVDGSVIQEWDIIWTFE